MHVAFASLLTSLVMSELWEGGSASIAVNVFATVASVHSGALQLDVAGSVAALAGTRQKLANGVIVAVFTAALPPPPPRMVGGCGG